MNNSNLSDELISIRVKIRNLIKGKQQEKNQLEQEDLNIFIKDSIALILNSLNSSTNSTNNKSPTLLNSLHEVLSELIKFKILIFNNNSSSLLDHDSTSSVLNANQEQFDLTYLITISNSLQWDSPYSPVITSCKVTLSLLLKLASTLELPLFSHLVNQLNSTSANFFSKKSIAIMGALFSIPNFQIPDFAALVLVEEEEEMEIECVLRGIFKRLLEGMDRNDVALACSKLILKWLEVGTKAGFNEFWVNPLLNSLSQGDIKRRTNLGKYVFSSLLVKGKVERLRTLLKMGGYLVDGTIYKIEEAIIMIEVASKAGLITIEDPTAITNTSSTKSNESTFILPLSFLSTSLQHLIPSIRISAFELLITSTSKSINAPFPSHLFSLFREFFVYNLGEEDSACCMDMVKSSSYLFSRLKESSHLAFKEGNEKYLLYLQNFLSWFTNHLISNLSPAKPFRIHDNAIRLLNLILETKVDSRYNSSDSKNVNWPFDLNLLTPTTSFILLRLLVSTYGSLRESSTRLLENFPTPLPGFEGENGILRAKTEILLPALQMIRSGREAEVSAASDIISFIWKKWGQDGSWRLSEFGNWNSTSFNGPPELSFISELMDLADSQLDFHEKDFARAASNSPLHGTIITLRQLFTVLPNTVNTEKQSHYKMISIRALELVKRVWKVTSSVLAGDPTGKLGIDTEEARAQIQSADIEGNGDDEVSNLGGPRHKIILSASWRSFKQAAELLETVLLLPKNLQDFWTFTEISEIGDLFSFWLRTVRHRGGYMAAYNSYLKINLRLSKMKNWPEVEALPSLMLSNQLDLMAQSDKISITRKSAGFKLCTLVGLLALAPTNPVAFSSSLNILFNIAESQDPLVLAESRVHAINTLCSVFLDNKLSGPVTLPYIERGYLLCISTFNSSNWICRNASLMLFGGLVNRTFGVARVNPKRNNESLMNRLSIEDFFNRNPALHVVLIEHLKSTAEVDASSDLHLTGLYSVLLLLSLLKTSDDILDSSSSIFAEPFIKLVQISSASNIWKIREASADAFTALISPKLVVKTCVSLLAIDKKSEENELHGRLVQVLRLLQFKAMLSITEVEILNESLLSNVQYLLHSSRSFSIRAAFFQIATEIIKKSNSLIETSFELFSIATERLEETRRWPTRINHLPSAESFVLALFTFTILVKPSLKLFQAGLASPFLQVQRHSLFSLTDAEKIIRNSCVSKLFDLIISKGEVEIQIEAIRLIMEIELPKESECIRLLPILVTVVNNSSVPLRYSLSPLIARLRNRVDSPDNDLYLVAIYTAAKSLEAFESRYSSLLSIAEFSKPSILQSSTYSRILLLLLQDDEHSIRNSACEIVSEHFNHSVPICTLRGCEILLGRIGPQSLFDQLEEMDADLSLLQNLQSQLFNVEKPNIYIDDNLEADFILNIQNRKVLEMKDCLAGTLADCINRWEQLIKLSVGPLGLASNAIVSKWVRRLIAFNSTIESEVKISNEFKLMQ